MSFKTSETTEKLDAALAKAQGAIENASKDKTNPHFKSKYADIANVWDSCRKALSENGISATQWMLPINEKLQLPMITRLAHSGQWMLSETTIPLEKPNAHGVGSAVTYLRRFALCAAVGIVADVDDDGNAAVENQKPAPVKAAYVPPAPIQTNPSRPVAPVMPPRPRNYAPQADNSPMPTEPPAGLWKPT